LVGLGELAPERAGDRQLPRAALADPERAEVGAEGPGRARLDRALVRNLVRYERDGDRLPALEALADDDRRCATERYLRSGLAGAGADVLEDRERPLRADRPQRIGRAVRDRRLRERDRDRARRGRRAACDAAGAAAERDDDLLGGLEPGGAD